MARHRRIVNRLMVMKTKHVKCFKDEKRFRDDSDCVLVTTKRVKKETKNDVKQLVEEETRAELRRKVNKTIKMGDDVEKMWTISRKQ